MRGVVLVLALVGCTSTPVESTAELRPLQHCLFHQFAAHDFYRVVASEWHEDLDGALRLDVVVQNYLEAPLRVLGATLGFFDEGALQAIRELKVCTPEGTPVAGAVLSQKSTCKLGFYAPFASELVPLLARLPFVVALVLEPVDPRLAPKTLPVPL